MKNPITAKCEKITLNVKSYAKCEKITLNVKNDRTGKCEKNATLNVKKSLVSCMTSQMVSLDNLFGLVSFFSAFSGFGVSTFQKLKIRKCHDLERKCKIKKKTSLVH